MNKKYLNRKEEKIKFIYILKKKYYIILYTISNNIIYKYSYILLDTPGQIEIFTWSASGAIITDTLAASYPTVVAYIIDTPRSTSPATFMSNMLYACRYC